MPKEINNDSRIKILDFMSYNNNAKSSRRDILWPYYEYNIKVYDNYHNDLNVLEHVVLRMLKVKKGDINEVCKKLCLEFDLVNFIFAKLKECGYIECDTNEFKLTESGEKLVSKKNDYSAKSDDIEQRNSNNLSNDDSEFQDEFVVVKFYQECASPNRFFLPYFRVDDKDLALTSKSIKVKYGNLIKYAFDNEDKIIINALKIQKDMQAKEQLATAYDVKNTALNCLRILKQNGEEESLHAKSRILKNICANKFTIDDSHNLVYLHLFAEIEKIRGDVLISNCRGKGYNNQLSAFVNEIAYSRKPKIQSDSEQDANDDFKWVKDLKNSETTEVKNLGKRKDNTDNSLTVESIKFFKAAKAIKGKLSNNSRDIYEKSEEFFKSLYRSLEYGLLELYEAFKCQSLQRVIRNQHNENMRYLGRLVKELSLNISMEESRFFNFSKYRYGNLQSEPDMQLLLFLCVCEAIENRDHPIVKLLRKNAVITTIQKLKKIRDGSSHGDHDDLIDPETTNELFLAIAEYLATIHPTVDAFNVNSNSNEKENYDTLSSDLRLKARIYLDNKFGSEFIQKLDSNYLDKILEIILWYFDINNNESGNVKNSQIQYISKMYRLFEILFQNIINMHYKNNKISEVDIKKFIHEDAQILLNIKLDPKSAICTAKENGIITVLRSGKGFSLQATFWAFLIASDKEKIKNLFKHCKQYDFDFIKFIDKVVVSRGHGQNILIDKANFDINNVNKEFLFAFKSIVEFF